MAIKAEDLIAPDGPIEPELFPGESEEDNKKLLTRLTAYVNQAQAKVTALAITFDPTSKEDDAVESWALYLAFNAAHTLTLARPAEDDHGTEVLGKTIFEKDQRLALKDLAEDYRADYFSAVEDTGLTIAASSGVPSYQSANVFDW